jgi:hypothetical protein
MSEEYTYTGAQPAQEPASQPAPPKKTKRESSAALNVILIIVGLLFFGKGLLELVFWLKPSPLPDWIASLHNALGSKDAGAALAFFGTQGIVSTMLGLWSFISGILLFRARETGWGMAIVVLSMIAANGISAIFGELSAGAAFDLLYWPNWVVILTSLAGIFGFFFLLVTRKRYS